jgi:hypothetical protein
LSVMHRWNRALRSFGMWCCGWFHTYSRLADQHLPHCHSIHKAQVALHHKSCYIVYATGIHTKFLRYAA